MINTHHLTTLCALVAVVAVSGCATCDDGCGPNSGGRLGGGRGRQQTAAHDRPFPIGQTTDAFWETQQTNAEAADFIFYDHEFSGETANLAPGAKRHLEEVALRLPHVPFPIVIEQSMYNAKPELDLARRQTIVMQLARMGVTNAEERVVVAGAFAEGFTAIEGERTYYNGVIGRGFGGGAGRRFGGSGGMYR
ncbi:MAG TPA: hypothetical protein VL096_00725 [Pirellulaceae bacterium]|nr:hypothetical protein [Pirellulaceae bacterium]